MADRPIRKRTALGQFDFGNKEASPKNGGRPGRKKGAKDLGPMLRKYTIEALELILAERQHYRPDYTMAMVVKEVIEEVGLTEWIGKVVSKYKINEVSVQGEIAHEHFGGVQHTHEAVSETSAWIEQVLGEDAESEAPESLPH